MNKYLKEFELYSDYQTYLNGSNADYPHIARCLDLNKIYLGPYTPVSSITLNEVSLSLNAGEIANLTATVLPANSSYRNVSWAIDDPEVASINNGVVTALSGGTAVITANCDNKVAICNLTVASASLYDYVDLGLPSGLLWCTRNVGATSETDDGLYFAWGETTGYADATARNAATGGTGGFDSTSYNAGPAASISADLTASNDAATAMLGSPWRMPTKTEFDELYNTNNTDKEWTTINGVSGYKFMKKSDHSVYVFFPASSYWNGMSLNNHGSYGNYWSSTYSSSSYAYGLFFYSGSVDTSSSYRRSGLTVRAVMNTPTT